MSMLNIEEVATYLETLINSGMSDNYKVFYWQKQLDTKVEQLYEADIPTTKQTFIPCILTSMNGKIRPIPTETIVDGEIILNCLFPATMKANALLLADYLTSQLNAQVKVISSENVLFGLEPPSLTSVDRAFIKDLANDFPNAELIYDVDYYITIQFVINYTSGLIYFGNQVKYSLSLDNVNFTELKRVANSSATTRLQQEEQLLGEGYAKTISQVSSLDTEITFILSSFNGIFRTLLDDIETATNQNRIYYLYKDYQNGVAYSYPVRLKRGIPNDQLGNVITLTCAFARAMI